MKPSGPSSKRAASLIAVIAMASAFYGRAGVQQAAAPSATIVHVTPSTAPEVAPTPSTAATPALVPTTAPSPAALVPVAGF